jgi:hypothetical protein
VGEVSAANAPPDEAISKAAAAVRRIVRMASPRECHAGRTLVPK